MKSWKTIVLAVLMFQSRDVSSQNFQWERKYDGSGYNDAINEIDDDDQGNLYGVGSTNTPFSDWLVIKYNAAGVEQWVRTFNGPDNNHERRGG